MAKWIAKLRCILTHNPQHNHITEWDVQHPSPDLKVTKIVRAECAICHRPIYKFVNEPARPAHIIKIPKRLRTLPPSPDTTNDVLDSA